MSRYDQVRYRQGGRDHSDVARPASPKHRAVWTHGLAGLERGRSERRRQHDGGAQQASLDPAPESVVDIEADQRERVPDATEVVGSAR